MKILLDTQIFLWYIIGDATRIPAPMLMEIRSPSNDVYLSAASIWEILVKHKLGKLPLPHSPEQFIPEQRRRHAIISLPVDEESAAKFVTLPDFHRDPFDRMLICQAIHYQMVIATVDSQIARYPIKRLNNE